MQKINFKNLPDTSTSLSASTLNQMQDNIESAIEDVEGVIPTIENSLDSDSTTNGTSVHATKLLNTYSTNELKIGTWIDGKPIYRKTITTTSTSITTDITNFDTIISAKGMVYISESPGDGWQPIPRVTSDVSTFGIGIGNIRNTNNVLTAVLYIGTNYGSIGNAYITFEYTKTTD